MGLFAYKDEQGLIMIYKLIGITYFSILRKCTLKNMHSPSFSTFQGYGFFTNIKQIGYIFLSDLFKNYLWIIQILYFREYSL